MFDPKTQLILHAVQASVAEGGSPEAGREALAAVAGAEPDLAAAVAAGDAATLKGIVEAWSSGKRPLESHDRDLLKRAMRAFRKRLGVTQLDDESTVGGGPMSGGRASGISGVSPPRDYPREIWLELARQGRLVNRGQGVFELGRGG